MSNKTSLMRAIAAEREEPLPDLLRRLLDERGITGACQELGVAKATMGYWMIRLGLRMVCVAVPPGHEVIVHPVARAQTAACGTGALSAHGWTPDGKCGDCGVARCVGILGDPTTGDTARCHLAVAGDAGRLCVVHLGMARKERRVHPGHWDGS